MQLGDSSIVQHAIAQQQQQQQQQQHSSVMQHAFAPAMGQPIGMQQSPAQPAAAASLGLALPTQQQPQPQSQPQPHPSFVSAMPALPISSQSVPTASPAQLASVAAAIGAPLQAAEAASASDAAAASSSSAAAAVSSSPAQPASIDPATGSNVDPNAAASAPSSRRARHSLTANPQLKAFELAALRDIGFDESPLSAEDLSNISDPAERALYQRYLVKWTMQRPELRRSQEKNEFTGGVLIQTLHSIFACACGKIKFGQKSKAQSHIMNRVRGTRRQAEQ